LIIEPGVAQLAALRRSDADLQDMRLQISKMASELESGRNAWEPDWGFHEAIARAAQNPILASISDAMGQRMAHPMWALMRSHNFEFAERAQRYLEHHREILLAIEGGDGDAAFNAMTRHLSTILQDLGSRPAPGEPIT
jgi:GntR family transcriptional repressor for pyruvate dehydrogenase complex